MQTRPLAFYDSITDHLSVPPIVRITPNLYAACFPIMKLVAAQYVVDKALREGVIGRDTVVVETSSGSYALGLAWSCAQHGLRFRVFTDGAVDAETKAMLELMGGDVVVVDCDPSMSPQTARLAALNAYMAATPNSFWPQQYDNPDHLDAYEPFAEQIAAGFGGPLTLVGSVGSGSSTSGTVLHLRRRGREVTMVGVDTPNSVLFGLPDGKRQVRGLGNSTLPKNVRHECYDFVHWLDAEHAYRSTVELYQQTGIFAGPTTGACWHVAKRLAAKDPARPHLFISADSGHRYLKSAFSEVWMREQGFADAPLQEAPTPVSAPDEVTGGWACIEWARRSLDAVSPHG